MVNTPGAPNFNCCRKEKQRPEPWHPSSAISICLVYSLSASVLLLLPLVAVLLGRERVLPMLQQGKTTLLHRGELVVGYVSLSLGLGLGGHLSWHGITGLALG